MKRVRMIGILTGILIFFISQPCMALEEIETEVEKEEKRVRKMGEIQVTAPRREEAIVVTPSATTINVEDYHTPGIPQNITDILKDRAIIDFRGESDLVPSNDTIHMRGFERFRQQTFCYRHRRANHREVRVWLQ